MGTTWIDVSWSLSFIALPPSSLHISHSRKLDSVSDIELLLIGLSDHSDRNIDRESLKIETSKTRNSRLVCLHVGPTPTSIPIDDAYHNITPLVAELKAKAAGATSSGVEKFHNVKARHTRCAAKAPFVPYP